jgi:hypothetical protein
MTAITAPPHSVQRGAIVSLLRGAFACPSIATLAELGLVEAMLAGKFCARQFDAVRDTRGLHAIFNYLASIGVLREIAPEVFSATEEGRMILKRSGAFLLLFSYREYFNHLGELLRDGAREFVVDRRQNVLGSGSLHSRKYFPSAWDILHSLQPAALIDIGCGDGHFLKGALTALGALEVAAVDLSPIAVNETCERLRGIGRTDVTGIVESGEQIERWLPRIPSRVKDQAPLLISFWFVVHEFSGGEPERVVRFFERLHKLLPKAHLLIGEIAKYPSSTLENSRSSSIMPEFLLFHALSGQGVLSWDEWKLVLRSVPYEISSEVRFDQIPDGDRDVPSSVIWHLRPLP